MSQTSLKQIRRTQRIRKIRATVVGTANRPRLVVQRSLAHINVQLIDDATGRTLENASDKGLTGTRLERAKQVGELIAKKALAKKINEIVFDRAGHHYHGRIAALATGAREAGLKF